MQYDQDPPTTLTPLPAQQHRHRHGARPDGGDPPGRPLGLRDRPVAAADRARRGASGRRYGEDAVTPGAADPRRPLRGASFLIADGVVPSNEDRGYILRRIMRRAIQQGRTLGLGARLPARFAERAIELMGDAYPELLEQRETIASGWPTRRRASGARSSGAPELLDELIERGQGRRARADRRGEDAFKLHDTYGFPYDLTKELLAEHGLAVDRGGLRRADGGAARAGARGRRRRRRRRGDTRERVRGVRRRGEPPTLRRLRDRARRRRPSARSSRVGRRRRPARVLVKLERAPVLRRGRRPGRRLGVIGASGDCGARVVDVFRVGDDQALDVVARARRAAARASASRRASTASAPRDRCQPHRDPPPARGAARAARHATCARRAPPSAPTSCASTSPTARRSAPRSCATSRTASTSGSRRATRCAADQTTLEEAKRLGAMALFGEKYGDVGADGGDRRRRVSRELCGGTHVRPRPRSASSDAQRGLERRQRAPHRGDHRARGGRTAAPTATICCARSSARCARRPSRSPDIVRERERERRELERALRERRRRRRRRRHRRARGAGPDDRRRAACSPRRSTCPTPRRCSTSPTASRAGSGTRVIVLGTAGDGRVHLVASVAPALVAARRASRRDRQARRRDHRRRRRGPRHDGPGRRPRPVASGRGDRRRPARPSPASSAVDRGGQVGVAVRVLALDYGSARCGCALSDPTGTIATPIEAVLRPATRTRDGRPCRARASAWRRSA